MTDARRSFILRLAAAVSYEQAVKVAIETRRAGLVPDAEILTDLISWDTLRAEEIRLIGAPS